MTSFCDPLKKYLLEGLRFEYRDSKSGSISGGPEFILVVDFGPEYGIIYKKPWYIATPGQFILASSVLLSILSLQKLVGHVYLTWVI